MKKMFGISLIVMLVITLLAVPAFASVDNGDGEPGDRPGHKHHQKFYTNDMVFDEVEVEELAIFEMKYNRWDLITGYAFQNANGITTVNMSSGNGNVLETNVDVAVLAKASSYDLTCSEIEIEELFIMSGCYDRWDTIKGYAFQNANGITTVNMSSGNGNVLQANIGVEAAPAVALGN